jgi:anti-sigma regulatory factor (Ser/Thr protein kinase)
MVQSNEIKFLESYSATTEVVPVVIDHLINDLGKLAFSRDEIDEIVLSMDEAITNAIQETIFKNTEDISRPHNPDRRDITVRYIINEHEFDATIIDHGKGLDIFNIIKNVPDCKSDDYCDQIITYATESEKNKIKVTLNGIEIPLKGIGAGLKIILNFMDQVTIDLIDRKTVLSNAVSEHTDGTIFSMRRGRRYQ